MWHKCTFVSHNKKILWSLELEKHLVGIKGAADNFTKVCKF